MAATTRKWVPIALHDELTEHTHLIRALRTSHLLDLTSHLLRHAADHRGRARETTDTWTQWPLVDCPVPEWSLADEIAHLAECVLRHSADLDRCDPDAAELDPAAARRLVAHAGAVLTHTLHLMADHRPSAPGSMQNRLWPMNWEDVISLLAVGGVVDPAIVARAERRLERIYGPSSSKAIERRHSVSKVKARFSALPSIGEDQLLAPPAYSRLRRGGTLSGPQVHHAGAGSHAVHGPDTDVDT